MRKSKFRSISLKLSYWKYDFGSWKVAKPNCKIYIWMFKRDLPNCEPKLRHPNRLWSKCQQSILCMNILGSPYISPICSNLFQLQRQNGFRRIVPNGHRRFRTFIECFRHKTCPSIFKISFKLFVQNKFREHQISVSKSLSTFHFIK